MDFFLTPQVYYVTGRNVSELHVICLEKYEHDLRLVIGRLGLPSTSGAVRSSTRAGMAGLSDVISISAEEEAYVRTELFPADTRLHAQRCGPLEKRQDARTGGEPRVARPCRPGDASYVKKLKVQATCFS
jgi:hypothetical protein